MNTNMNFQYDIAGGTAAADLTLSAPVEAMFDSTAEESLTVADVSLCIQKRLRECLAEASIEFDETISEDMSFDYIGLDSLARVNLLAALDKEYGMSLDPTAAYDFVTIGALAQFVWSEVTGNSLDTKKILEV